MANAACFVVLVHIQGWLSQNRPEKSSISIFPRDLDVIHILDRTLGSLVACFVSLAKTIAEVWLVLSLFQHLYHGKEKAVY